MSKSTISLHVGLGEASAGAGLDRPPPATPGECEAEQLVSRDHFGDASSLSEAASHFPRVSFKDLPPTLTGVEIFNDSGVEGTVSGAVPVLNPGNFGAQWGGAGSAVFVLKSGNFGAQAGGAGVLNALIILVARSSASSFIIAQSAWIIPGPQPKSVSKRFVPSPGLPI